MPTRKWPTKKYQIASRRGLTSAFDDAFDAREAAKVAVRRARQGYTVEVQTFAGGGFGSRVGRKTVHMTCKPADRQVKAGRVVADCTIKPAFKKRIKGL